MGRACILQDKARTALITLQLHLNTKQNQKHSALWFTQTEVTARNTFNSFLFFQSTLHAQIITLVIQYKKVINKTFEVNSSFLGKYI